MNLTHLSTKLIFISFFFLNIIMYKPIFADTANVYCANEKKEWKWLKNTSDKVKVSGEWKSISKKIDEHFEFELYFFKIDGGLNKFQELVNLCINNYGSDYIFAQPAQYFFSIWSLFGNEDETKFSRGFADVEISCPMCTSDYNSRDLKLF